MKRIFISIIFLIFALITVYAGKQESVKLDNEHTKKQIYFANCNIFVTMIDSDDEGNSKVMVEIENLDDSNAVILFGKAYQEKDLKKFSPSISFDKKFSGTKGKRVIENYDKTRNDLIIKPTETKRIPEILIKNAETQLCRLPLYIAKPKSKKGWMGSNKDKLLLMDMQILELEIEVEAKADEDFLRLEKECNDLIDEISRQTFCTNTKHKPSLEAQEAPYKKRISRIMTEIDEIIEKKLYTLNDRGYQRYNEIKLKLDAIDFSKYEGDCGMKHKGSTSISKCKYCNLSPQQIYHKLDDYLQKIYSSNNRKATKDAVMSDVKLLYSCRRHSPSWKNSEYKSKITEHYNKICKF